VLSGRGLCDELITRPEGSFCMIQKPQKLGVHGLRWAAAPHEKKSLKSSKIIKTKYFFNITSELAS
jgi:hypothetical protein